MRKFNLLFLILLASTSVFASNDYPHAYGEYVEINYDDKHAPVRPVGSGHEAVTERYGKLIVTEGDFTAESDNKPWSSWWYPRYEKTLFEDKGRNDLSTLSKYDRFARKSGQRRSNARNYEEQNLYTERAVDWAGLCDAWALASIMAEEPVRSVRKKGITFTVKDLKALVIKTYSKTNLKGHFGQRNNGAWDDHYEDIYPDQFHKFFQVELFEKRKPFIIDYDAGMQVWNVPVFKVKTKITADPQRDNMVNVKTFIWYASPFVKDLNFVGIRPITKIYKYKLFGRWTRQGFEVSGGQWMKESRRDHPDFVMAKPDRIKRGSFNKELQADIVDKILKGSY
ncbi:MAG: hypothetical protein DRQ88_03720 [Epsilonproteobacteria bacterium]|nr:MAG: hypothetical protein DRQ89_03770 [Campylobacterota bacterium]RLA67283.1 MAG: hypothetical protein DRQ88_03720 [Campylobacterota bacterium]